MAQPVYRVENSADVREQYLAMLESARKQGRYEDCVRASAIILDELEQSPLEFGESRYSEPSGQMLFRWAMERPVIVEFAVVPSKQIVFIKRFVLNRN